MYPKHKLLLLPVTLRNGHVQALVNSGAKGEIILEDCARVNGKKTRRDQELMIELVEGSQLLLTKRVIIIRKFGPWKTLVLMWVVPNLKHHIIFG